MAKLESMDVDVSTMAQEITLKVNVTNIKAFRVRLWIVTQLIKLANFVATFTVEIESDGDET